MAWGVLEHVMNPISFQIELNSYLKPKGLLILTTVNIDSVIPFRYKPPEHLSYWTEEAMLIASNNSNYALITYEPYTMYQNKNVYMDIILRTVHEVYKKLIQYNKLPELVNITTNEVFIVLKKNHSFLMNN